jgi:ABC-type transport system involved in cytochrome c biogenesis ATPase subunit
MAESGFPYHERLRLQNFTAFTDATFEFVPGINVLIGENGTGKTHVMKALYAWQMARHLSDPNRPAKIDDLFAETYGAASVGELRRTKTKAARAVGAYAGHEWSVALHSDSVAHDGAGLKPIRPIFIPAIEMMAHARNMSGILRDYADFDRTCFDFISMVTAQQVSSNNGATHGDIDKLKRLVPGEVEWNNEEQRFYLVNKTGRLPFQLVAEGVRKIAALERLVKLKWLQPGGVLFWDEPEANVNPTWMDDIAEALVALAESNVQIFLTTHSYVMMKEIDMAIRTRKAHVPVRFFLLHKERGSSKVMWSDDFGALEPNPILDHYDEMLEEDMRLYDRAEEMA